MSPGLSSFLQNSSRNPIHTVHIHPHPPWRIRLSSHQSKHISSKSAEILPRESDIYIYIYIWKCTSLKFSWKWLNCSQICQCLSTIEWFNGPAGFIPENICEQCSWMARDGQQSSCRSGDTVRGRKGITREDSAKHQSPPLRQQARGVSWVNDLLCAFGIKAVVQNFRWKTARDQEKLGKVFRLAWGSIFGCNGFPFAEYLWSPKNENWPWQLPLRQCILLWHVCPRLSVCQLANCCSAPGFVFIRIVTKKLFRVLDNRSTRCACGLAIFSAIKVLWLTKKQQQQK